MSELFVFNRYEKCADSRKIYCKSMWWPICETQVDCLAEIANLKQSPSSSYVY